jgi:hypothetical protein
VPRPVSWLPRITEIRRSVKNSVRSHYERKDIERLFQVQPRSAQALIQGIAPSAKVGQGYLLARADLETFLEHVAEGSDPASLLALRPEPSRRRLRELIQVDQATATLDTAPSNISFQSGQLGIDFASMEQLAGALLALAEILDNAEQFAAFEDRYVPRQPQPDSGADERADVDRAFAELERMEQERRMKIG